MIAQLPRMQLIHNSMYRQLNASMRSCAASCSARAIPQAVPSHLAFTPRSSSSTTTTRRMVLRAEAPAAAGGGGATVTVPPQYAPPQDPEMAAFQQHQSAAARLSPAEDVRTIIQLAKYGLLSTVSAKGDSQGFPSGSVVEFAVDGSGQPLLSLSTLSSHTRDLQTDGRCSLTVMTPGFKGLQDARFCLTGTATPITEAADKAAAREAYMARHPHAFYVDFGDFLWFRVGDLKAIKYNGGFARAAVIPAAEYQATRPDPVAAFSVPVCKHMNEDHEGDLLSMVTHYTGLNAATAQMLGLDRLGADLVVTKEGNPSPIRVRLPFPKPAEDRKGIKEALVDMTKAARAASSS